MMTRLLIAVLVACSLLLVASMALSQELPPPQPPQIDWYVGEGMDDLDAMEFDVIEQGLEAYDRLYPEDAEPAIGFWEALWLFGTAPFCVDLVGT